MGTLISCCPDVPCPNRPDAVTRGILEAVPAGVVHVRADGAILAANAEALHVLGLSFDAITQRYTAELAPETIWEDGTRCPAEAYPVTLALSTGRAQPPTTIGVRRPGGQTSWAVFRAVPLLDEASGTVSGAVVTFLDITERKAAESARQALEEQLRHAQRLDSIGQLAGGIAHDFNNLLQIILGNVELAGTAESAQALADIRSAAERASALTEGLLSFARRQPATHGNVSLADVVPEVVVAAPARSERRRTLRPGGPETILVVEDEEMIRRLVVRVLTARGYDVLSAANGFEALALLQQGTRVDLLLVDVIMPGMRGPELVRRARELEPALRVLFTTGYEPEPDGEARGADPVLYKPYTPDQLMPRVRELLDGTPHATAAAHAGSGRSRY